MKKYGLIIAIFLMLLFFGSSCAYAKKDKLPVDGKGYVGTLPVLTRDYASNSETTENKSSEVKPIPSKDFNSEGEIKPAPIEDPAFVNIILKTDKTSKYANDLNEFVQILEDLYDTIDEGKNVQLFNAKVYYFNKSAEYFRDKYASRPEAEFVSYKRLMELSAHSKTVALLRSEAEKYNPYLSYSGSGYIYNPNNIREQLGYLKTEIRQTILLLRESE